MKTEITKQDARCVLTLIDKGLSSGLGNPEPGQMCVEAAVAYAFGEDHDDHPTCVNNWLANQKISVNDYGDWLSDSDRAKGLRRLAIAQLGSAGCFNKTKFMQSIGKQVTAYLKARYRAPSTCT